MEPVVEGWWKKAQRSLDTASYLLKGKRYEEAVESAHKSAERGLKALLLTKEPIVIKTHDLLFLAERTGAPAEITALCKQLTPTYMESRYPIPSGEWKDYEKDEAESDILRAKGILVWIKKNL